MPRCAQGTAGGEAIQFGASRDRQTAADTAALSGNVSTGAATFAFILAHNVMLSHDAVTCCT